MVQQVLLSTDLNKSHVLNADNSIMQVHFKAPSHIGDRVARQDL